MKDLEEHGSAGELLADWRTTERDTVAARSAASVAALAVAAATSAEEAAHAMEVAAEAVLDAAEHAKEAATHAKTAASQAADAARLASAAAVADKRHANDEVERAEKAEATARDRIHDAQAKGFSKESGEESG